MLYRLYAKARDQKRFKPMDYQAGVQVTNLMYATVFAENQLKALKEATKDLNDYHKGNYVFEIRKASLR